MAPSNFKDDESLKAAEIDNEMSGEALCACIYIYCVITGGDGIAWTFI